MTRLLAKSRVLCLHRQIKIQTLKISQTPIGTPGAHFRMISSYRFAEFLIIFLSVVLQNVFIVESCFPSKTKPLRNTPSDPQFNISAFELTANVSLLLGEIRNYDGFFTNHQKFIERRNGRTLKITNKTILLDWYWHNILGSEVLLVIKCQAKCPVQWTILPVKEELRDVFNSVEVISYREYALNETNILKGNYKMPPVNWHISTLIWKKLRTRFSLEIIGEYTCECIWDPNKNDKIWIGWASREKDIHKIPMLNAGKVLHLQYNTSEPECSMMLPCGLTETSEVALLYVQPKDAEGSKDGWNSSFVPVSLNSSIVRLPVFGYELNMTELPWAYRYLWICSNAQPNESIRLDTSLLIHIEPMKENMQTAVMKFLPLYEPKPLNVSCSRVECTANCSQAKRNRPQLDIIAVRNEATITLLNLLVHRRKNVDTSPKGIRYLPDEEQPDFVRIIRDGRTWNLSAESVLNCPKHDSFAQDSNAAMSDCFVESLAKPVEEGFIAVCNDISWKPQPWVVNLNPEYLFMLTNTFLPPKRKGYVPVDPWPNKPILIGIPEIWPTGFSKATFESVQVIHQLRVSTPEQMYRARRLEHKPQFKKLGEPAGHEYLPVGADMCFFCDVKEHTSANGILWAVEYTNGSKVIQTETVIEKLGDRSRFTLEAPKNSVPRTTSIFCTKAVLGMVRLACHAPIWNSNQAVTSVSLKTPQVHSPSVPKIRIDQNKSLKIYDGDDLELLCTITSLTTPMVIQWLINGVVVDQYMENTVAKYEPSQSEWLPRLLRHPENPARAITVSIIKAKYVLTGRKIHPYIRTSFELREQAKMEKKMRKAKHKEMRRIAIAAAAVEKKRDKRAPRRNRNKGRGRSKSSKNGYQGGTKDLSNEYHRKKDCLSNKCPCSQRNETGYFPTDNYLSNCSVSSAKINITETDTPEAGIYTCRVIIGNITVEENFHVDVMETKPPEILNSTATEHNFMLGDLNQELRCEATGDPIPSVTWHKGNATFSDALTHTYRMDQVIVCILRIRFVSWETAGAHICRAKNQYGEEANKSFIVNVSGPPNRTVLVAVILSVSFLVTILILMIIALRRRNIEKLKLIELERVFRNGTGVKKEDDEDLRVHFLSLPYITEKYEIERNNLKIGEVINSGEYGVIHIGEYHQKDSENHIRVAIKTLNPKNMTSVFMESLCNELKVMMQINHNLESHENLINFYGAVTNEFQKYKIYLVMEYCENGSMLDYILKSKNDLILSRPDGSQCISARTMKWAQQIAQGMAFLSENKIIHVDLAARNVLITRDDVAKVGDFGLSKLMLTNKSYYANRGQMGFHPLWTPPECFPGKTKGRFTAQSDVWSYGVTLWEIFSLGQEPRYSGPADAPFETLLELGTRLCKPSYADVQTFAIMQGCWDRTPENRPKFPELVEYFQDLYERTVTIQESNSFQTGALPSTSTSCDQAAVPQKQLGTSYRNATQQQRSINLNLDLSPVEEVEPGPGYIKQEEIPMQNFKEDKEPTDNVSAESC